MLDRQTGLVVSFRARLALWPLRCGVFAGTHGCCGFVWIAAVVLPLCIRFDIAVSIERWLTVHQLHCLSQTRPPAM